MFFKGKPGPPGPPANQRRGSQNVGRNTFYCCFSLNIAVKSFLFLRKANLNLKEERDLKTLPTRTQTQKMSLEEPESVRHLPAENSHSIILTSKTVRRKAHCTLLK